MVTHHQERTHQMNITLNTTDLEIIKKHDPGVRGRALMELIIVHTLINVATRAGYRFEIADDPEEKTETADEFKLAVFNRDDVVVDIYQKSVYKGWIHLVFGNDGCDLISDYTTNLESFLEPVNKVAELLGS